MKKLQTIIILAMAMFAFACTDKGTDPIDEEPKVEGIELIAVNGTDIVEPLDGELSSFYTEIKNIGEEDINVYARMEIVELGSNMASYFCWGDVETGDGTCYPPMESDFTSDFTLNIKAGETTPKANFIQYVTCKNMFGGTAKIRYIVYEEDNMTNADTIVYNVKFGL